MVTIRAAVPEDAGAIGAIWLDAWRVGYRGIVPDAAIDCYTDEETAVYWRTTLADPERAPFVVVAEHPDAGVVGFAQAGPSDEPHDPAYELEVWELYIDPAYQRRGIGRLLMAGIAERLAAHGLGSLRLRTFVGNAACGFYERLGGQYLGMASNEILGDAVPTLLYGWPDLAPLRATGGDSEVRSLMASSGQRPLKVGIQLRPAEDRARGTVPRWTDLEAMAREAEAVGFDSVWVSDHLIVQMPLPGAQPQGAWEGWSLLAALAAVTERAELGTLVACTAFRNPALLAKMADTVDEISGGRLILGLGAGWHEPEFTAFGYPFDHRVSRFEEALTIITGLLRQGHVDVEGTYYRARDCELRPRGPRPHGPPILIGASGVGERMLRLAARHADVWNRDFDGVNPGCDPYSPEDLAAWQPRVDGACVAVGRDPATLARTAGIFVDLPGAPPREGWGTLSGSPEEIAEGVRGYAQAGFTHVQLGLNPNTAAAVASLAPILELLDRG